MIMKNLRRSIQFMCNLCVLTWRYTQYHVMFIVVLVRSNFSICVVENATILLMSLTLHISSKKIREPENF